MKEKDERLDSLIFDLYKDTSAVEKAASKGSGRLVKVVSLSDCLGKVPGFGPLKRARLFLASDNRDALRRIY